MLIVHEKDHDFSQLCQSYPKPVIMGELIYNYSTSDFSVSTQYTSDKTMAVMWWQIVEQNVDKVGFMNSIELQLYLQISFIKIAEKQRARQEKLWIIFTK